MYLEVSLSKFARGARFKRAVIGAAARIGGFKRSRPYDCQRNWLSRGGGPMAKFTSRRSRFSFHALYEEWQPRNLRPPTLWPRSYSRPLLSPFVSSARRLFARPPPSFYAAVIYPGPRQPSNALFLARGFAPRPLLIKNPLEGERP